MPTMEDLVKSTTTAAAENTTASTKTVIDVSQYIPGLYTVIYDLKTNPLDETAVRTQLELIHKKPLLELESCLSDLIAATMMEHSMRKAAEREAKVKKDAEDKVKADEEERLKKKAEKEAEAQAKAKKDAEDKAKADKEKEGSAGQGEERRRR